MPKGIERRRSERIRCAGPLVFATYGVVRTGLTLTGLRGRCMDRSVDRGGFGLETSHALYTGQRLSLQFRGAAHEAVVRWVVATPGGFRGGVSVSR